MAAAEVVAHDVGLLLGAAQVSADVGHEMVDVVRRAAAHGEKGFFANNTAAELQRCADLMVDLIDRFNAVQQSIPATPGFEHVNYVNLRPLLSNRPPQDYKDSWENELHPTEEGFTRVAQAFPGAINALPIP